MIVDAIARFVASPAAGAFEQLALEAFAFQFERVAPYRRWCETAGRTPPSVRSWRDIPAIPASAMKMVALHAAPPRVTFRSSGTTRGERRSEHHHPFPDLYRTVIDCSFPAFCLPRGDRPPMLSLIAPFSQQSDSSLSFMVDHVLATFGGDGTATAIGSAGVDAATARRWLETRERDRRPGFVLATALALDQLLQKLERGRLHFRSPVGTALFLTGGFKTRHAELRLDHLLARLEHHLGLPSHAVVQEYGMTELTSQAYTTTLRGGAGDAFACPHWMRVRVLDPATLEEARAGAVGLVAVLDLANVGSALHLLTEDLGLAVEGGGFRLAGRAAGAELRGCSLRAEEIALATDD